MMTLLYVGQRIQHWDEGKIHITTVSELIKIFIGIVMGDPREPTPPPILGLEPAMRFAQNH